MATRRSASILLAATICAGLCLSGCSGSLNRSVARNPEKFSEPDPSPIPTIATDRKLDSGDIVTIQVYKVDSLSGDQTIDAAGRITLPLIGSLPAAGRTTSQLQEDLASALGRKYLTAPVVLVALKTAAQKMVTVDGSVQQPGIYPIETNPTLLRTVAMARGVSDDANPHRVVVFRQVNGQRMAASFDLRKIQRGHISDPAIYPDDVIVVDGSALNKTFKTLIAAMPFATLFRPY